MNYSHALCALQEPEGALCGFEAAGFQTFFANNFPLKSIGCISLGNNPEGNCELFGYKKLWRELKNLGFVLFEMLSATMLYAALQHDCFEQDLTALPSVKILRLST